ncbi:MAG: queuosine precursor transporter [Chloroflexi bacterium]|nr:queuosine precursor transporter [Chloroflexota bacterium]
MRSEGGYRYLNWVTGIFVTCLIVSNIIVVKIVGLGPMTLSGAIVIFPISYIFGDILTEVYGYARSRQVIWIGFACNLLAVLAIQTAAMLPAADFWDGQAAYDRILGYAPRFLVASLIAYLLGEFVNSFILAKLKIMTRGKWLWSRTISSTLFGQIVDTAVFSLVAFVGTLTLFEMVSISFWEWLIKCSYEIIATPVTYAVVNYLKRTEHEDYYDYDTDFNPLKVSTQ